MSGYDAVLLTSFGGPEGPEEVVPFLQRVTAGRGIPAERLVEVGQHYFALGGVSPINGQNRELIAALRAELLARGHDLPVVLGNRNSEPYVADTLAELAAAGHRSILALATSAYSSYSGCRQYREDLGLALAGLEAEAGVRLVKARPFCDSEGFVAASADLLAGALGALDPATLSGTLVLFTTHSIPVAMATTCGPPQARSAQDDIYSAQHRRVAEEVLGRAVRAAGVGAGLPWRLVYQSRSGPPHVPWLEPDVNDAIREAVAAGVTQLVVVPIGFISDHIEVIWDLDTEAAQTCRDLGVPMVRVPTVGTHPRFVSGLVDLILAHLLAGADRSAGTAWEGFCGTDCCPNVRPGSPPKPVVAGVSA